MKGSPVSVITEQSHDSVPWRATGRLALVVELDRTDDTAMLRVLTLLARRRCSVTHVAFAPDPDAGCDRMRVDLDAPRHLDRNLIAWVSTLVPVLSVRCA